MSPELEAVVGARTRRVNEMQMALASLALGAMFVFEPRVFELGQPLHMLAWVAPSAAWGLLFTIAGTTRLVTLIVNGFWPLGARVRWWLSSLSLVLIWLPLTAGYWLALPQSFGFPTLVLAVIAAIGELNNLFALSAYREERRNAE